MGIRHYQMMSITTQKGDKIPTHIQELLWGVEGGGVRIHRILLYMYMYLFYNPHTYVHAHVYSHNHKKFKIRWLRWYTDITRLHDCAYSVTPLK